MSELHDRGGPERSGGIEAPQAEMSQADFPCGRWVRMKFLFLTNRAVENVTRCWLLALRPTMVALSFELGVRFNPGWSRATALPGHAEQLVHCD